MDRLVWDFVGTGVKIAMNARLIPDHSQSEKARDGGTEWSQAIDCHHIKFLVGGHEVDLTQVRTV